MLLLLGGFLLSSTWLMKCYTNHGESMQVPKFVGMHIDAAEDRADSRGFELEIIDSIFKPELEAGIVLEQAPVALSRVKPNRTIYITISKALPDMVTLPKLDGANDDYQQYSRLLKRLQIRAVKAGERFDNKLTPGTILAVVYNGDTLTTRIAAGVQVPVGSKVELIVSRRGGDSVPVPDLACITFDEAEFLITSYNLVVGTVRGSSSAKAYITSQNPAPGTVIRIGEQVSISTSSSRPSSCPADPLEELEKDQEKIEQEMMNLEIGTAGDGN